MRTTPDRRPSSRDSIVTEAAHLFAARGYRGTSIADIQTACGLTAGSGALYKHFPSKRAVLEAVVRRHSTTLRRGREIFARELPHDPRATLRLLVTQVWGSMAQDRELLRIILRDADCMPDLVEEIWRDVVDVVYTEVAQWLRAEKQRGRVDVADPEASAAVLMASLTHYPILDALIEHAPGNVSADAFAEAWVSHASAALGLSPT